MHIWRASLVFLHVIKTFENSWKCTPHQRPSKRSKYARTQGRVDLLPLQRQKYPHRSIDYR